MRAAAAATRFGIVALDGEALVSCRAVAVCLDLVGLACRLRLALTLRFRLLRLSPGSSAAAARASPCFLRRPTLYGLWRGEQQGFLYAGFRV
jgi:hypothetical protein